MTVSNTTVEQAFTCNGSTVNFTIPFVFLDTAQIKVYLKLISDGTETLQSLATHYTLTGGPPVTTVSMVTAPSSLYQLVIKRVTDLTQVVDYINNGGFLAESHESALDRLTMQMQEVSNVAAKAAASPATSGLSASKALVTDVNGVATTSAVSSTELGYVSGATSNIQAQLNTKVFSANIPLSMQKFLSGSGTYNLNYQFIITSGSATAAATYTHNSVTYTVNSTVASSTRVIMSGSAAPLTSGTLTKASGSGDATITFSQVLSPKYIEIEALGAGGGGGGSSTTAANNGGTGGTGGTTTFGSSLISCTGGLGGTVFGSAPGSGGTATLGTGPIGKALSGGYGGMSVGYLISADFAGGAMGGVSPLGGAGSGGAAGTAGFNATANSGSGGGGASSPVSGRGGSGGGAGGYANAIIINPSPTYTYAIGAAGTAGSAGTGGFIAGAGGSGYIEITEVY
jgi:hypothetical protein